VELRCFQGNSLGGHANVGVMLQHRPADVASKRHDGLVRGLAFGELCNCRVAEIVEAENQAGALRGITLCRAPSPGGTSEN
jgi:hypothetical protein